MFPNQYAQWTTASLVAVSVSGFPFIFLLAYAYGFAFGSQLSRSHDISQDDICSRKG